MVLNAIAMMPDLPEDELDFTVQFIGEEIELGLAAEDQDWNVHHLAATFYRAASQRDARYRELALHHLAALREVAPRSPFLQEFPDMLKELDR